MKKQYIKPATVTHTDITPPTLLDSVSLEVKDNKEEITDPSEQLSKKHFFPLWEDEEN